MKIVSIVAARPNFVKLAGFHHAFAAAKLPRWKHIIVHTGQHYDPILSEVFFRELDIPEPHENLAVKGGETNEDTIERTCVACKPVLQKLKPDLVVVYGDVSGALGGAMAAHEIEISVAHVEAGLRSGDLTMPEEGNRIAIDHIASLLFVTEQSGIDNLKKEGITKDIYFVGNTMIDTLMRMFPMLEQQKLPSHLPKQFGVVTLHRPSNVDNKTSLLHNIQFLKEVAEKCPLVFPIHPRTRALLQPKEQRGFTSNTSVSLKPPLYCVLPLQYLAFVKLLSRATVILTDSGGVQEEAAFLKKRCFTLRKNTERPCTLEENGGSNMLIDLEKEDDRQKVLDYAANPVEPKVTIPEKWDGKAGERIIDILKRL